MFGQLFRVFFPFLNTRWAILQSNSDGQKTRYGIALLSSLASALLFQAVQQSHDVSLHSFRFFLFFQHHNHIVYYCFVRLGKKCRWVSRSNRTGQAVDSATSIATATSVHVAVERAAPAVPAVPAPVTRRLGALWALCHLGDAAVHSNDINCSEAPWGSCKLKVSVYSRYLWYSAICRYVGCLWFSCSTFQLIGNGEPKVELNWKHAKAHLLLEIN